jgi:glucose-6-phosphate-specific signal transduction histidine kinase
MSPPWITRSRVAALAVTAALFVAVEALLFAVDDPRQAVSVLFVLPIAVCALRGGQRGGLAGALVATVLLAVWVLSHDVDLTFLGWLSRLIAFFVLGVLLGRFEDLTRDMERRRMRELHASEVQDEIVQALVVARYQLQSGEDWAAAATALDDALGAAKEIVTRALGDDIRPGDLRLSNRR